MWIPDRWRQTGEVPWVRHTRISDALAPQDYGSNKVELVPDSDGALIRMHLKGHAETGANGWTFGFVAVRNGTPRYGPLTTTNDGEISFQTQPGESRVFLVVMGTPTAVPKYAFLDGWPKNRRYPYEFRIFGAIPDGHQPGYVKPAPVGGRWHANGGGWVRNGANVAASAYVGPRAAIYSGNVLGNARIEDLAWVNGGRVTDNAIVRHNAIVHGGVTVGGNAIIGGDAEPPAGPTGGEHDAPARGAAERVQPVRRAVGGQGVRVLSAIRAGATRRPLARRCLAPACEAMFHGERPPAAARTTRCSSGSDRHLCGRGGDRTQPLMLSLSPAGIGTKASSG